MVNQIDSPEQYPDSPIDIDTSSTRLTFDQVKTLVEQNNNTGKLRDTVQVSTELLLCQIWKESGFNPTAKNPGSTATGLMQITEGAVVDVNKNTPHGVHFEHTEMTDPQKNVACATYYLGLKIRQAKKDIKKALEHYGTGIGYADNILICESCLRGGSTNPKTCLTPIHPILP
ncbi:lytic transglycosylase domain-containing protein [Nostoc sp. LEGE 12450]|uniref:lytic transglycosylase domain-containing protein n=1 Tax=Nostoc sp. LEGE 12450 TaxID=1828643 RepID=UPI0018825CDD|nr:lytic transglycosylase domain-containing protein [Nostoc sp. LEGE 12450]MBE8989327.1 lytic transglycosylase domain-containing protein [Nostoc sp. LEGE 12450]